MASPAPTFKGIKSQIASGTLAPIYVIHGAEGYYTDELLKDFEALVPESERDFNFYQLYAPETPIDQVLDACGRYPMMADRQVVILKEAQNVRADYIDKLAGYAAHPNPLTVFVVAGRGDKIRGAKFLKAVNASGGVVFESRKLSESQVGPMVEELVKRSGLSIDSKARAMLVEHVGTDLSRMVMEINKIALVLPKGSAVTPQVIEKLIGVSKEFNNTELLLALAGRDTVKAYKIVEYFRGNPKMNPSIMTNAFIFGMFSKMFVAMYEADRSERGIAKAIGTWPGSDDMKRMALGMRNYTARQVMNAIGACRRFDCRAKGVGSRANEYDLLRELVFTILN